MKLSEKEKESLAKWYRTNFKWVADPYYRGKLDAFYDIKSILGIEGVEDLGPERITEV